MATEVHQQSDDQITTQEALKLYRNTLNFNVISRYDPDIKQLLYHTSHSVVYKFNDDSEEWVKTDYQGTLALYMRNFEVPQTQPATQADLQNLFCYGLILLNRNNPECFSLGLLPNKITKAFYPRGVDNSNVLQMDVELNDNLIIVKDLLGDIYGLWVFNEDDRIKLYKSLEYCLDEK